MDFHVVRSLSFIALAAFCSVTLAQNVKVTSLGSHAGELCNRDPATIFEDPSGVRILYDAGQSVTGADDPRLGRIDVVLLAHAHGDHIGDMKMKALEAGTCDNPQLVSAAPNSTTAEIAAAKNAALIMEISGADNVSFTLGPPIGYVIRFTNGLVLYLTGDTGIHSDMQTVARDYYKAHLVELNFAPIAINPEGAAYAVNTLIQPASVIVSHVNEGATSGGKLKPNSRTAAFIALVKGRPVYPALSGKTMEFEGAGKCVAGC